MQPPSLDILGLNNKMIESEEESSSVESAPLPPSTIKIVNQQTVVTCADLSEPFENSPFFLSLSMADRMSYRMTCTLLYAPFFSIRKIVAFICCPTKSPLPESPVFKPATTEYLAHYVQKNANKLCGDRAVGEYTLQRLCANKLTFSDAQQLARAVHVSCEILSTPNVYVGQNQAVVNKEILTDDVKSLVTPSYSYWEPMLQLLGGVGLDRRMCIDLVLLLNSDGVQKYCVYALSAPGSTINAGGTIPKIHVEQLRHHIFSKLAQLSSDRTAKYTVLKNILNVLNHPVAQTYFDQAGLSYIFSHENYKPWGTLDNFTCPIVKQYFDDMVRADPPVPVDKAITTIFFLSSNERLLFSSPVVRELYDGGHITMQDISDLAEEYPSILLMCLCEGVVSYEKLVGLTPIQEMNIHQSLRNGPHAPWDKTSFIHDLKNNLLTIEDVLNETRLFLWYSKLHKAQKLTPEQRKNADLPWVKGHILNEKLSADDVLNNSFTFRAYSWVN